MKIGEYDITLSPLGWFTLAAAAAANTVAPGRGFRVNRENREGNRTMAYQLTVWIVNPDDEKIYVEHNFFGETKADAEHVKREHLESCEYFRAAQAEGRTVESGEEIESSDWPEVEGDDKDEEAEEDE
jgi:hypothetical protein